MRCVKRLTALLTTKGNKIPQNTASMLLFQDSKPFFPVPTPNKEMIDLSRYPTKKMGSQPHVTSSSPCGQIQGTGAKGNKYFSTVPSAVGKPSKAQAGALLQFLFSLAIAPEYQYRYNNHIYPTAVSLSIYNIMKDRERQQENLKSVFSPMACPFQACDPALWGQSE